eukprot:TRINITY_DN8770_c0_g1_i1.p1 TRINITY_DN8770_c0_g1~~TRINITY_DN8770_c0_g1_i1.p1  ORF type:complete len:575 (+),score=209.95 TRINITY_DN8770_c0_g1_i1:216-1940(+)
MTQADGGVADQVVHAEGDYGLKAGRPGEAPKLYTYDHVFTAGQDEVYDCIGRPMLADVMEGYNVTLFAYGQTGSGKTYSIQGATQDATDDRCGIVPRFCFDLLRHAQQSLQTDPPLSIKMTMSMLEIYNENVRDLLARKSDPRADLPSLDIHEQKGRIFVQDLSYHTITGFERMQQLIAAGLANRQVHETQMNATSSRSHSIVQLTVIQTHDPPRADCKDVESVVNIVDLAGSERQDKTGASGDRFEEAKNINKSLLTLGRALNTFADGKAEYVPLRDSKLTRLLSESFGGNARTWMLACVSPSTFNYVETLSTLQYAQNAKNIVNKAKINAMAEKLELKQLKVKYSQLERLFDAEKELTQQLRLELARRAEFIQQLQKELSEAKTGSSITSECGRLLAADGQANMYIGRAQLSLKNIIQLASNYVTLPLISDNPDGDGATLTISTYPLKKHREQQTEEGEEVTLESLLGKRIDLIVHVIGARGIPAAFSSVVYCTYVFKHAEKDVYQTDELQGSAPEFDFKKRYAFGSLTQQLADYLASPNVLTFQVFGERAPRERTAHQTEAQSPTMPPSSP